MAVEWTAEQRKVIELRNRSILVSAAAGSGKTAVLVQRILGKLLDTEHPVDIDRMLIMTFTRAAAAEMKERLSRELEKALYEQPENEHLQRQMNLIHTAQITTIDGFCAYVIRNYFHLIDLDPGYRVAEEGELKLLQEDILKDLLEDSYAEGSEEFASAVEALCPGKNDETLHELILKLYRTAVSDPNPEQWLKHCLDGRIPVEGEPVSCPWYEKLWITAAHTLEGVRENLLEARELCLIDGGPYLYEDAVNSDILQVEQLEQLMQTKNYDRVYEKCKNLEFVALSRKKMEAEESLKKQVKTLRESAKKALREEVGAKLFGSSLEELQLVMEYAYAPLHVLVDKTLQFMKRFDEKKREKNLLDFGDMEHLTLKILGSEDDGGNFIPSRAARELSEKYEEVMVDEYQDSNLVQEIITRWVSGWAKDQKNVFMVGDVKQSIYRFRQAKPELFMEKYHRFTEEDSSEQRIDLHRNFRSRAAVLESVNYLCRQLMGADLGGIDYDEAAALYPGAAFPAGENKEFLPTEILLLDKEDPEIFDQENLEEAIELEALVIAKRIKEMVGKENVLDSESKTYRPMEYGDIAVLLRSISGSGETLCEVLSGQGIPVYAASRTGYFSTLEIKTLLNYLRVIDNPRQDIPLAGVLTSPIGGCTSQELAELRCAFPEGLLMDSVQSFLNEEKAESEEQQSLKKKLNAFVLDLNHLRDKTSYTSVHQLILDVLETTGYGQYASALPDGAQRSANLLMLVEKAMEYEKTSYQGLFNFVRYIEQLHQYEVDFGEVNLSGAGKGAVQVMTIHKSKGLEFPVVFAAGMGKQFNFRDMNAGLLVHPSLGAAMDAVLPKERLTLKSPQKQVLRQQLLEESLGEELRVLYVALTRAKEKLILTGTIADVEKNLRKFVSCGQRKEELLPYHVRVGAKCFWDWILPALMGHPSMTELLRSYGIFSKKNTLFREEPSEFQVQLVSVKDLVVKEIEEQTEVELIRENLIRWDPEKIWDEEIRQEIEERFSSEYSAHWLREIPGKISVSELKKRNYHTTAELEETIVTDGDAESETDQNKTMLERIPLPRFMQKDEQISYTGAERGTAYHRVMECLDYREVDSEEKLNRQIENMVQSERLSRGQADCIKRSDIEQFLSCDLGMRMREAALNARLMREQPFMIMRSSEELNADWHPGIGVIVQGIIDAYFFEEDEIVLVDYKTDRIQEGQEQRLIDWYHTQLEDYACALERMTGRKVKETYIYSFTLHKPIAIP